MQLLNCTKEMPQNRNTCKVLIFKLLEVSLLVIKSYIFITLIFVSLHNEIFFHEASLMKKAVQNIKTISYFLFACLISNVYEIIHSSTQDLNQKQGRTVSLFETDILWQFIRIKWSIAIFSHNDQRSFFPFEIIWKIKCVCNCFFFILN
jgi:hypothetical protein